MSKIIGGYEVLLEERIGTGAFGNVYKARDWKYGGTRSKWVAAKHVDRYVMKGSKEYIEKKEYVDKISHQNIIQIYDIHVESPNDVWIFMDLCKFGDLTQLYVDHPEFVEIIAIKVDLMQQALCGLSYLHDSHVVHRDFKPGNILIDKDPDSQSKLLVKLSDFALAKWVKEDHTSSMQSNVGTQHFKAPEFWNYDPEGKIHYGKSVDVFAAGLTLLCMIQGLNAEGILKPRIEGDIRPAEHNFPIGMALNVRHTHNLGLPFIAVENPNDNDTIKEVKRLINEATHHDAKKRISAKEMYTWLKSLQIGNFQELN